MLVLFNVGANGIYDTVGGVHNGGLYWVFFSFQWGVVIGDDFF